MAIRNILPRHSTVLDNLGEPLAGGRVFLYEPGTTTPISAFGDSSLATPQTQPILLSGDGRSEIWISRDADLRVEDRNQALQFTASNVNPDSLGVSQAGGLVPNGSFEVDSDSDGTPDGWTETVTQTSSDNEIDISEATDGAQSYRFTGGGSGGGELETTEFFPVNDIDDLRVSFDIRSTVATVLNIARVRWFDSSQVFISNGDAYNEGATNPTSFAGQTADVTPPANARFAKLLLIGVDPAGTTDTGSTFFDKVRAFYPTTTTGVFGNVTIQNNEIITTNTNGDLEVAPDGSGSVNINQAGAVDLSDHGNALNVGTDDPANDPHIAVDRNTVQAKTNETTATILELNRLGGEVRAGGTRVLTVDDLPLIANATSDVDRALTATPAADPEMVINSVPIGRYILEAVILWNEVVGNDQGIEYGFTSSGTFVGEIRHERARSVDVNSFDFVLDALTLTGYSSGGTAAKQSAQLSGMINVTVSGDFTFEWSQETSNASATRRGEHSFMRLTPAV